MAGGPHTITPKARDGLGAGGTQIVGFTDVGNVGSITKTGLSLTNGTTYYVSVRAYDAAGNRSSATSSNGIAVDTTSPTVPTGVAANPGNNSATVSWTASSDTGSGLAGYVVRYVQASTCPAASPRNYPNATALVTATNTTIAGLASKAQYCFYVTAQDNAGNSSAASSTVPTTTK